MKNLCILLCVSLSVCISLTLWAQTDDPDKVDDDGAPVPFFMSRLARHQCLFSFRALLLALCSLFVGTAYAQTDPDLTKVDNDGDGLIEIWTLTQLDHMRHNLAGTSYKNASGATGVTTGCGTGTLATGGTASQCHGYELMADLDFRKGCGDEGEAPGQDCEAKWVPLNNADPMAAGALVAAPASGLNPGWTPIGSGFSTAFTGTFEGNGHAIYNLYINATASSGELNVGLFGYANGATLRNLGLTGARMSVKGTNTGTGGSDSTSAGALVGYFVDGILRNCYATGRVSTAGTRPSYAGGLIGLTFSLNTDVSIGDCYATGAVEARNAGIGFLWGGGLVGSASNIGTRLTLSNCYALGTVKVTGSGTKYAGGLAGQVNRVTVTNSYHSGTVTGATESGLGTAVDDEDDLRAPTGPGASGETYEGWSIKDWYFGSSKELPRLRVYREDSDGEQVAAGLVAGQSFALDADGLVGELRALVDDYTTDVDRSVSGEDYLRVKKLVEDLAALKARAEVRPEKGEKGDPGAQGGQGEQGVKGNPGEQGAQGAQGKRGPQGDQGDPGEQGAQGERGPQGVKGDKGDKGAQGERGPQGVKGDKGEKGDKGDKGEKGDAPDVSGFVRAADFDALKKRVEVLEKGGGGNALASVRLESRVVVRPNPVKDRLVVESPVLLVATVLDSGGQRVLVRQLSRGEQVIDVSDLVAGSYLLVLQTGEGTSSTHKFVKQHR